ncbi:MAG: hypothetical protein ACTTJ4_06145, partial [Treponema sp.]|uniref:hypothetical protein n=1 Tax=Treponema sp. TaxID=166 RepID=UPI003FA2BABD
PPPPPPIFWKYTAHLRCRFIKNSPRRTSSTPAGVFYTLLASASSISKRHFSTATDGGGYMQQRRFCEAKTRRQQMYKDVHLLARYLYRLFPKGCFRNIRRIRFLAVLNHSKFAYSLAFLLKEINSS